MNGEEYDNYVVVCDPATGEDKTYIHVGTKYHVGTGGDPDKLKDVKDMFTSIKEAYAKVPLTNESPFKAHYLPKTALYELSEEENKRFDELCDTEEEASIAKKCYAKLIGEVPIWQLPTIESKTYRSGIRYHAGIWSPMGPIE